LAVLAVLVISLASAKFTDRASLRGFGGLSGAVLLRGFREERVIHGGLGASCERFVWRPGSPVEERPSL
jgi:hypothetical protein